MLTGRGVGSLFDLLGYQFNLTESEPSKGKTYRMSHRDPSRDQLHVHLIDWHESLESQHGAQRPADVPPTTRRANHARRTAQWHRR